jgi:hypothetical protein
MPVPLKYRVTVETDNQVVIEDREGTTHVHCADETVSVSRE